MRKNVFGRQLKRDKNERKALFKAILSSLVIYEKIETTEAKAKAIKRHADKMITKVKKHKENAKEALQEYLAANAIQKFITDVAPRFEGRSGGYTRIIRAGRRRRDSAQMVIMEWVEGPRKVEKVAKSEKVSKKETAKIKKSSAKQNSKVIEAEIVTEKIAKKKALRQAQGKTKKKDKK